MSYKERLTILHEAEINDLYGIPSLSLEGVNAGEDPLLFAAG
jgi:hypothetical protein